MNFIEAHALAKRTSGGELAFTLAMSGSSDALDIYIRAHAAQMERKARVKRLPFNTLGHWLRTPGGDQRGVLVMMPWDFLDELDWRSGVDAGVGFDLADVDRRIGNIVRLIQERANMRCIYIDAPVPPSSVNRGDDLMLRQRLKMAALECGAEILDEDHFSLATYLASGCPIASPVLSTVAETIVRYAAGGKATAKKVLVTDLDNVLWRGVVAEDGPDGIFCQPEGVGFVHFLYQTLLKKLKTGGALLAAVSRNRERDALTPFEAGAMHLAQDDFVTIVAGYGAKSAGINSIAAALNLSTKDFVFIDDNEIELAEVELAVPGLTTLRFPANENDFVEFADKLHRLFSKTVITDEDRSRTELYRRSLMTQPRADAQGADLSDFLKSLRMTLSIRRRSTQDFHRAIQLINKTNQFSLNGRQVEESDVARILDNGGHLFAASLADRSGDHGEILSCLIESDGTIRSFVLSCRVFQRKVEHRFVHWLIDHGIPVTAFDYVPTDRNEPIQRFIADPAFVPEDGVVRLDAAVFMANHDHVQSLFVVQDDTSAKR